MRSKKIEKKDVANPFVFTKKTPFMQRIADLVRTGHRRYVMGQIAIEKAGSLAAKFDEHYGWSGGKVAAHRSRQAGFASARLLFLQQDGYADLTWLLLCTVGKWTHPDAGREKWRDPITDRIGLTGYELVRHQRASNPNPSWTWRYTSTRYDEIRELIILSIRRKNDEDLKQWIHSIWRSPAFAGVREQVKKWASLIKSEWKRSRGADALPEMPKGLGYVRRIADKGVLLSAVQQPSKPVPRKIPGG